MRWMLILMLAALAACTHDVALRTPDGQALGQASLAFDSNHNGTLSLKVGDTRYSGAWVAQKVDEREDVARRYGRHTHVYREYVLGRGHYLWQGQATVRSEQGTEMQCQFSYRGTVGRGQCVSEAGTFDFVGEG